MIKINKEFEKKKKKKNENIVTTTINRNASEERGVNCQRNKQKKIIIIKRKIA